MNNYPDPPKEVLDAMNEIKAYCRFHHCDNCAFDRDAKAPYGCFFSNGFAPIHWFSDDTAAPVYTRVPTYSNGENF